MFNVHALAIGQSLETRIFFYNMFLRDNISMPFCCYSVNLHLQSHRYDTHLMMALVHGNVRECAARLALAEQMMKVRSIASTCTHLTTPLFSIIV